MDKIAINTYIKKKKKKKRNRQIEYILFSSCGEFKQEKGLKFIGIYK
jgi:hypothetical protein